MMKHTEWRIVEYMPEGQIYNAHYDIYEGDTIVIPNIYALKDAETVVRDHNSAPLLLEALAGILSIDAKPKSKREHDYGMRMIRQAQQAIKEATQ